MSKFDSLKHRSEPMTAEDRSAIRLNAILTSVIGGVMMCILTTVILFGVTVVIPQTRTVLFIWIEVFVCLALAVACGFLFYYIRRSILALRLTQKIIYSGKITGKRISGGYKESSSYYMTLDEVEFFVERQQYRAANEGDFAEFHCTFPGDVFRVVRPKTKNQPRNHQGATLQFTGNHKPFRIDLRASAGARLGILIACIVVGSIITLSSFMDGRVGNPPKALLYRGNSVTVEVTATQVKEYSTGNGKRYYDIVWVSPVQKRQDPETADPDESPPRRKFELMARSDVFFDGDQEKVRRNMPYTLGQKFVAYTLDESKGPYYAIRYSGRAIFNMVMRTLMGVLVIGIGIYSAFHFRNKPHR
jgi:hypothetical protein